MYLDFYKLREFPFAISCDERFFYASAGHSEALANMMYTIAQRKGMVLVSGEVGAGKTFVSNLLVSRLGPSCQCVLLQSPPANGKQLLRAVCNRAGLALSAAADKLRVTDELEQHLLRLHSRGRLLALLLDEAQDLTAAVLEELRLLWNWECQGQRLIQIVLLGQPELRHKLLMPRWEPLRQRIVLSYHLQRLQAGDVAPYIAHRLAVASPEGPAVSFTDEAADDVYAAACGIPRSVNVLCDAALLVGYTREARVIGRQIIAEVLKEMMCWGVGQTPQAPEHQSVGPGV